MRWLVGALLMCGGCDGSDDPERDSDNEPVRTCDTIESEFQAETADIRSCTTDAECGQVLAGTSCGCTRNWVARNDADLTTFDALMAEAGTEQCDLGTDSVCDCPATAGFRCDDAGQCNWNYVDDYDYLPQCTTAAGDAFTVTSASLDGDELVVGVEYSGGCETHDFVLCWPDQSFQESNPVQVDVELFHEDNDDACDAIETEERRFSLAPVKQAFEDAYQSATGTVTINVGGESLTYTF